MACPSPTGEVEGPLRWSKEARGVLTPVPTGRCRWSREARGREAGCLTKTVPSSPRTLAQDFHGAGGSGAGGVETSWGTC